MSAENPWEDAPRDMLEREFARQAVQLARMVTERVELLKVIEVQMDAIGVVPLTLRAGVVATPADVEWYCALVTRLQTVLARQCGTRTPLNIADGALRDLTNHILEGVKA